MSEEKRGSSLLYKSAWRLLYVVFKIVYRLSISGKDNIPKSGGAILVANHTSFLDPPILAISTNRKLHFMAKEELFKIPLVGRLLFLFSAFPVDRKKADLKALKTALDLLKQGNVVALFPEGTRQRLGHKKLGPLLTGAAFLALKSGMPLIPVGITGTDQVVPVGKHLPRFPKIYTTIGKPIYLANPELNRNNVAELTNKIGEAIINLII